MRFEGLVLSLFAMVTSILIGYMGWANGIYVYLAMIALIKLDKL